MNDSSASKRVGRDGLRAWVLGGSLMLASVGVDVIASQTAGTIFTSWIGWLGALAWAASLAVFALGIRGEGSVVGRRPLGVAALLVAALVPLVFRIVWTFFAGPMLDVGGRPVSLALGYAEPLISAAALLIAVVAIARADVVPRRVRWVPAVVLACNVGMRVLIELVGLTAPMLGQQVLVPLFAFAGLVGTAGSLLLGILAVVSGSRREPPATVQVYPPPS
ncbi:hypothetical protein QL996_08005 [Planococcus sp. APC 4015]|nr:hypothetical protein [Planococcus sp. APC 4015]